MAAVLLALALSCSTQSTRTPGGASGFQSFLDHSAVNADAGSVDWSTSWRLTWEPVADATGYAVYFGTSEGQPSGPPQRVETSPEVVVQAAAGSSPPDRIDADRRAALAMTAAQLTVAIAPVGADGSQGPRSPWFAVGATANSEAPAG